MTILSKPIPILREEFLQFLNDNKIKQFSTKNVMEWYKFRMTKLSKKYNIQSAYPAIHKQVIYKLLFENKITRISRGLYEVNKVPEVKPVYITKDKELSKIAEDKWARLSRPGFNPDSLLDTEVIERIKK